MVGAVLLRNWLCLLNVREDSDSKRIVVVVEMKNRFTIRDVKEFINELGNFLAFFDEYKDSKVIGVVGSVKVDNTVVNYAEANGLCVIKPLGDIMVLLNKEAFVPKIWS